MTTVTVSVSRMPEFCSRRFAVNRHTFIRRLESIRAELQILCYVACGLREGTHCTVAFAGATTAGDEGMHPPNMSRATFTKLLMQRCIKMHRFACWNSKKIQGHSFRCYGFEHSFISIQHNLPWRYYSFWLCEHAQHLCIFIAKILKTIQRSPRPPSWI